jgi:hypothetical protein
MQTKPTYFPNLNPFGEVQSKMFSYIVLTQLKSYRKTFEGKLSMHEDKLFMEVPGMCMEQYVILYSGSPRLYIIKMYHHYRASSKTKSSSLYIAHNF